MKRELVRADIARRLTFFSAGEESELIRIRWCGDRGYCKINLYIYILLLFLLFIYFTICKAALGYLHCTCHSHVFTRGLRINFNLVGLDNFPLVEPIGLFITCTGLAGGHLAESLNLNKKNRLITKSENLLIISKRDDARNCLKRRRP